MFKNKRIALKNLVLLEDSTLTKLMLPLIKTEQQIRDFH